MPAADIIPVQLRKPVAEDVSRKDRAAERAANTGIGSRLRGL